MSTAQLQKQLYVKGVQEKLLLLLRPLYILLTKYILYKEVLVSKKHFFNVMSFLTLRSRPLKITMLSACIYSSVLYSFCYF